MVRSSFPNENHVVKAIDLYFYGEQDVFKAVSMIIEYFGPKFHFQPNDEL